jgi:hypothetical protein
MEYIIPISRTKTDLPAITETGGATGKTKGEARLVCRNNGSKKTAIYIPPVEERAEKGHAVFVLQPGDYIVIVIRSRNTSFAIDIAEYTDRISVEGKALFEVRHSFKNSAWDTEPPDFMLPVIEAAKAKTRQNTPEPLWFEKKVAPPTIPTQQQSQTPFARSAAPFGDSGLLTITELTQIAPDEFSLGLSNGIQMLIYIKNLPVMRR